jgi:galactonate dehydratase
MGAPVHDLLGGSCRDAIRIYQWIGGDRPDEVGNAALAVKQKGGTAVKMHATAEMQIVDSHLKIDQLVERVAALLKPGRMWNPSFDPPPPK